MPLGAQLSRFAQAQPQAPAIAMGGAATSYAALWHAIAARYGALAALPPRRHAIAPGQPLVALLLGNHAQMPHWLTLGLAAPVTLALLDPGWPEALQHEMLARLAPDLVITPENAGFGLDHAPAALPPTRPDQPFFIGFTSGTTSRPKAFLRDRSSWRLSLEAGKSIFSLDAQSHTLAPGPLVHGLTFYALTETLHAGACFTGMARFAAAPAFDLLADGNITRLVAVPTMLEALMREADARGATLATRQITTAGSALPEALLARLPRAFPRARITNYYGASELGFVSLAHHTPDGAGDLMSNERGVGRAFPGVEIEIRADGRPVPTSTTGTVFVRSPHPISGYLIAEGETAFARSGEWTSVGDLGALDEAGNLTLAGRADGMVISGGYNIYPQEVAEVLARAPGVRGAEVLGLPDPYLGAQLVAVVRPQAPLPDLAAFCAQHLPRYKVPRAFFAATEWPLTASGKVARAALQDWIERDDARLTRLT